MRIAWILDQIAAELGDLQAFRDWSAGHGLPRRAALGVAPEDHAVLAQEARLSSSCCKVNPVDLPLSDLTRILQSA
ncbi:hypothetical protein [Natronohydrobacter thiooxidans]|uniref:hypothetical protein n=1 Tax=Natronohydrobacter thiooxidans TaxID=87172 RepID=UPI0008FF2FF6|nr:hypothetical protein [Natronohydrobacter thiooxidans]